jgi:hypothetical protein
VTAEYAIMNYKNSIKEIRDEAYTTLMSLYKVMGAKLNNYLTDIRKAALDVLKEGFYEIDGVHPEQKSKAPASEPTITTNIDPHGAAGAKKKGGKTTGKKEEESKNPE